MPTTTKPTSDDNVDVSWGLVSLDGTIRKNLVDSTATWLGLVRCSSETLAWEDTFGPYTLTQEVDSATQVTFEWTDDDVVNERWTDSPNNCGGPGYDWSYGIRPQATAPSPYDYSMTSPLVITDFTNAPKSLSIVA